MRVRLRDFVYTTDDLFFATTNYLHPKDRILSFLRYIPDPEGERSIRSRRYSKVDSKQAYEFLNEEYPEYLFKSGKTGIQMMGVPHNKVSNILRPNERLKEILNIESPDELLSKVIVVADTFHNHAKIPYDKMGVSGSILPGLYDPEQSDIDFVIYGLKNHRKAVEIFAELKKNDTFPLKGIDDKFWMKLYKKRIKDASLSYDEFKWYESRKNNRGVVHGTLFDILATKDWDEIKGTYGDTTYERLETAKIECIVSDAIGAFDNPAVYKIEDLKILEGPDLPITEVASFTHTYSGQAREGERIIAQGAVEKVVNQKTGEIKYRLMVGTTRESFNEYIKLKDLNLGLE